MKRTFAIALMSIAFFANASPDSTPPRFDEILLSADACDNNCTRVVDYGPRRTWLFIDGNGRPHLDYDEQRPDAQAQDLYADPLVYFYMPAHDARPDATTCGEDGWGWATAERIHAIDYGEFTQETNYSHAGQAVRVLISTATGALIGAPTSLDSGVRPHTASRCSDIRRHVSDP